MGYRLAGVLIVAFWLAMMGWLVVVDVLPDLEPLPASGYQRFLARLEERPRVDRMGIWFGSRRLGFTQRTYTRLPDGEFEIESRYEMAAPDSLNLMEGILPGAPGGGKLQLRMVMNARVGADYQLKYFDIDADLGGTKQRILGTLQGGELSVTAVSGGKQEKQTVPFDSRTVLGGLLAPSEYAGKLRLGHAWDVRFIDPFSGRPRTARRKVVERQTIELRGAKHATFVVETRMGETTTRAWVAADGRVLREQRPFGLRLEREEPPRKR